MNTAEYRWTRKRKAAIVTMILQGRLSLGEAFTLHRLTLEELRSWGLSPLRCAYLGII